MPPPILLNYQPAPINPLRHRWAERFFFLPTLLAGLTPAFSFAGGVRPVDALFIYLDRIRIPPEQFTQFLLIAIPFFLWGILAASKLALDSPIGASRALVPAVFVFAAGGYVAVIALIVNLFHTTLASGPAYWWPVAVGVGLLVATSLVDCWMVLRHKDIREIAVAALLAPALAHAELVLAGLFRMHPNIGWWVLLCASAAGCVELAFLALRRDRQAGLSGPVPIQSPHESS